MPLSPRHQRGYFDVVVKRGSKGIDDGLDTTRSDKAFSHFLDKLPIGKFIVGVLEGSCNSEEGIGRGFVLDFTLDFE